MLSVNALHEAFATPDAGGMRDQLDSILRSITVSASAMRNGSIRRAMAAYLAFNTVEMASWTTILVYAYGATGPGSVGLVAILQLIPSAVAAPLLANIGDRFPRATVLLGWFLVQALLLAATGVAIVVGAPPIVVYLVSALASISLTQTRPILASLLPELARSPEELTAANAWSTIFIGVGGFLGPVGAAILLAVSDAQVTFLVAAGVLAVGGVLLIGLHGPADAPLAPADDEADARSDGRVSILAGLREVARDRDLLVVVALLTGEYVIYGGLEILLVLTAIELLGIGESGAAALVGAVGLGGIIGGAAAFALVGRRRLAPWLGVAAVVIGVPIALIGFDPVPRTAAILVVVSGIGFAIIDTAGQTLLQRITPDAVRARVFGVLEGLILVGEAVGSLIVPPIALVLGLQGTAIAIGLLLPLAALLAVGRFSSIDARVKLPEAELRALRRVPMLAPLGPAAIETLARHLVRVPVVAGTAVIREGDAGDRWYLVERGAFDVSDRRSAAAEPRAGRRVRRDRAAPRCPANRDGHCGQRRLAVGPRARRVPRGGDGLADRPARGRAGGGCSARLKRHPGVARVPLTGGGPSATSLAPSRRSTGGHRTRARSPRSQSRRRARRTPARTSGSARPAPAAIRSRPCRPLRRAGGW